MQQKEEKTIKKIETERKIKIAIFFWGKFTQFKPQ